MKNHEHGNLSHDDFGDNLGLGFDNGDIRGAWADITIFIISNLIEVEFGEPEATDNYDMKTGEW